MGAERFIRFGILALEGNGMSRLGRLGCVWAAALLGFGLLASCAEFREIKGADYTESARLNFKEGLRNLDSENYEIAQKYFGLVTTSYAFSQYAIRAELMVGESLLKRELYAEAISAFKSFQRNHPSHPCISYAQYRSAEAYFKQIPDDWWFMPPTFERDQDQTEKALREFETVIEMEDAYDYVFPAVYKPIKLKMCEGYSYETVRAVVYNAQKSAATCRTRLTRRELYVADYYAKRDKPLGTIGRLEPLLARDARLLKDSRILKRLADAYKGAHMYKKGQALWTYMAADPALKVSKAEMQKALAALKRHEDAYLADQEKKAPELAKRQAREAAFRAKHKLSPVDPDPDPNSDAVLPFLEKPAATPENEAP